MLRGYWLIVGAFLGLAAVPAAAQLPAGPGDWPGWRGPDRTNLSKETGLLTAWPAGGPKLLYKIDGLGSGFSTVSIARGKIYVIGTDVPVVKGGGKKGGGGARELMIALDVKNGKRLWATPIGPVAGGGGRPGPRSTPTVDGGRVYGLNSSGNLVCLDANKGNLVWSKDLPKVFAGRPGGWAYAESVLIDGDRLICAPGGGKATIVCLNKADGSTIWTAPIKGMSAHYASAIVADVAGEKQYIHFLSGGVVGVSAGDGKERWRYTAPANGTANCSTPLYADGMVFAASGYRTGGGMVRVTRNGGGFSATQAYFVEDMQNHHGGMVLVNGHIYGTGSSELFCIDIQGGRIVWRNRSVGKGSVVFADGHLIVRSERGDVALVEATPAGYREKGRFSQPDRAREFPAWAHPVVAGGRLYLRDLDKLLVYDISSR